MPQDELEVLKRAADGLEYPSESDTPFDAFRWPATGPATAKAQLAARAKGRKIEEVPVEAFFAALDDSDDAPRFRALQKTLQSLLTKLQVFRVGAGEVKVDIYLIGKTAAKDWAGLHTISVET